MKNAATNDLKYAGKRDGVPQKHWQESHKSTMQFFTLDKGEMQTEHELCENFSPALRRMAKENNTNTSFFDCVPSHLQPDILETCSTGRLA